MKTNIGQNWYQAIAYDLPFFRWKTFYFYIKGPWPFKFKETFFSILKPFIVA
jgi:hypothetical protein